MTVTKLKNIINKRISKVEDLDLLNTINLILDSKDRNKGVYNLTEIQRKKIEKSKSQLRDGKRLTNEKVFDEVGKWLKEK